jgi:uncharacterized protein YcfJ
MKIGRKIQSMKSEPSRNEAQASGTDANRDPITGAPGAHTVGTGVGAVGGAMAGAAAGAIAGPVGAAVGLVAGAVAGGLAGKGVAEKMDPTVEDTYWKDNFTKRTYVDSGAAYETYQPGYRTGYGGRSLYPGKSYEDVEADLQRNFEKSNGSLGLSWIKAKQATRDAWDHVGRPVAKHANQPTASTKPARDIVGTRAP